MMERRWKGNIETSPSPSCPRCGSCNTKFCYYNNYSLTQPRYFCKACRRYWTKGGSLRNVPLGGGSRKSRRPSNIITSRSSSSVLHHYSNSINGETGASLIPASSTNSMDVHDPTQSHIDDAPPHIDLALVYANFLNPSPDYSRDKPKPHEHDQLVMQTPVLDLHHDHSVQLQEYSTTVSNSNICTQFGPICSVSLPLPQHNLYEGDYQTYSDGTFICMQQDGIIEQCSNSDDYSFNLPLPALPLPPPGEEEAASHDDNPIMWSGSHEMMVNHGMQAAPPPPPPVLGTQPHDDVADFIMAKWDPFHDHSFPKP